MSSRGAECWEQIAHPRWQDFVSVHGAFLDNDVMTRTLGCGNSGRLEEYLANLHLLGIRVAEETIEWRIERPWQATYWKSLAVGHCVSYEYIRDGRNVSPSLPATVAEIHRNRWYNWTNRSLGLGW